MSDEDEGHLAPIEAIWGYPIEPVRAKFIDWFGVRIYEADAALLATLRSDETQEALRRAALTAQNWPDSWCASYDLALTDAAALRALLLAEGAEKEEPSA